MKRLKKVQGSLPRMEKLKILFLQRWKVKLAAMTTALAILGNSTDKEWILICVSLAKVAKGSAVSACCRQFCNCFFFVANVNEPWNCKSHKSNSLNLVSSNVFDENYFFTMKCVHRIHIFWKFSKLTCSYSVKFSDTFSEIANHRFIFNLKLFCSTSWGGLAPSG